MKTILMVLFFGSITLWPQSNCLCEKDITTFNLGATHVLCAAKDYNDPATRKPVFISPILSRCAPDSTICQFSEKDNYFVEKLRNGLILTALSRMPVPPEWVYRSTAYKTYRCFVGENGIASIDSQLVLKVPAVPKRTLDKVFAKYNEWNESLGCPKNSEDECPYYSDPSAMMFILMYAAVAGNQKAEEALMNANKKFSLNAETGEEYKDIVRLCADLKNSMAGIR